MTSPTEVNLNAGSNERDARAFLGITITPSQSIDAPSSAEAVSAAIKQLSANLTPIAEKSEPKHQILNRAIRSLSTGASPILRRSRSGSANQSAAPSVHGSPSTSIKGSPHGSGRATPTHESPVLIPVAPVLGDAITSPVVHATRSFANQDLLSTENLPLITQDRVEMLLKYQKGNDDFPRARISELIPSRGSLYVIN